MNKDVGALRQLFDRLFQEQQTTWFPQRWGIKPSAEAQMVWRHLVKPCPPITRKDFEHWFPASLGELHVDFSQWSKFLYLPRLEKDAEFVPVLSVKCDLDETKSTMKLRVMLIQRVRDCDENDGERLRGIGFRLEGPHGDEEEQEDAEGDGEKPEGRHDFYHAQLIRDFDGGPSLDCPDWLPCNQPSFPLIADCPVTLVLCLLLALYGKRYSWEFLSRDTALYNWLKPYVEEKLQPWIKWEALA